MCVCVCFPMCICMCVCARWFWSNGVTGKPIFVCTIVKYSTVDCLNVNTRICVSYCRFFRLILFFFCSRYSRNQKSQVKRVAKFRRFTLWELSLFGHRRPNQQFVLSYCGIRGRSNCCCFLSVGVVPDLAD